MRDHCKPALLILLSLLLLTACEVSPNDAEQSGATDPSLSPNGGTVAQTTSTHEFAGTPTATPEDTTPGSSQRSEQTSAAETPLVMATSADEGPIEKDVPTGPAATEMPISRESNFDRDGNGFYSLGEFKQAITALYPSYDWPEDYQVDLDKVISGIEKRSGPNDQYEVPGEYTILGLDHVCAWGSAWLDAYRDGNTALMEESLYQLQVVALDNPLFVYIRNDLSAIFARAALGDPSMIQQYVDSNCSSLKTVTSDSTTPQAAADTKEIQDSITPSASRLSVPARFF